MTPEYVLIITPTEMKIEEPNVDSQVFLGTFEEIEELFNAAMEDSEIKENIVFARVIKKAEVSYVVTNNPESENG